MGEVKIFKISGRIVKANYKTEFSREIRAIKEQEAVEKVYADFGSQHRVKRSHVLIDSIEEISPEDSSDMLTRAMSEE